MLFGSIFLFLSTHTAYGKWVPFASITLEQLYDSNIFLDPDDFHRPGANKSDFRTNIFPSIGLRNESEIQTFSAEYVFNYSYFVNNSDQNYAGHTGNFDFERQIAEHMRWYMHDSVAISEEPRTDTYDYVTVNYGRRRNLTNDAETGLEYSFGREDRLRIYYADSRLDYLNGNDFTDGLHQALGADDSVTYGPGMEMDYWITLHHGLAISYDWERTDYKIRASERRDHLDVGYTYRFSPHTAIRSDFVLDYIDSKDPLLFDYKIYQATLGIMKIFGPSLSMDVYGGFYYRPSGDVPDSFDTSDNEGFSGGLSLTYTQPVWHLTISGEAGARVEYGDYNNRGYTPYRSFSFEFDYSLTSRLRFYLNGSYDYEKSPDIGQAVVHNYNNTRRETYDTSSGFEYEILPWLHSRAEYEYSEESSNRISGGTRGGLGGYTDHKCLISLSADYDWL